MWYLRAMRHYGDFEGRARRIEFWECLGDWIILTMSALAFDQMRAGPYRENDRLLELAVAAIHLVPFGAVAARRSHDLDRPGWLALLGFVPMLGFGMLLVWVFPGTSGPNRFGPEPGLKPDLSASAAASARGGDPGRFDADSGASPAPWAPAEQRATRDNPLAVVGELERLADLLYAGVLTDAEFEDLKRQTIAGGHSR